MLLFGFFMIMAGYLIIWGRIPVGSPAGPSVAGHPVLVRIAGIGLAVLVLFAHHTGNPTFLWASAIILFLLLALSMLFGR